jgi:tetratricopeptide (TPR) repeat protein
MRAEARATIVALVAAVLSASAHAAVEAGDAYRRLVARYREGDRQAARELAVDSPLLLPSRRVPCGPGAGGCEAAAVLNLEALSLLFEGRRRDTAAELLDATLPVVRRSGADFAFDWLLAAGALCQAWADHAGAFRLYQEALALRPADAGAIFARATTLEFSVIPDGFGALVVADQDVWPLLQLPGWPPSELAYRLANPKSEGSTRPRLLEVVTREYRDVLRRDPAATEARLRLGRVLEARGHRAEAEAELRAVAVATTDRFSAAIARLCLARLEQSPSAAAEAYRAALEVDPGLSQAWLGLSQALRASGDRPGAVQALAPALAHEENVRLTAWVEYHLGRGRTFPAALEALSARVRTR